LNQGDDLLHDLGTLVDTVRAEQTPGPLVLLGHSLGGLVVGRYAAGFTERKRPAWRSPVDAVVMISPALTANKPPPATLVNLLDRLWPALSLSTRLSFDPNTISRDPEVVQAYLADPRIHLCITPRLARFIMEAGAFTLERAPHWALPTLLLYAGADRIVDPRGSVQFAQRAPSGLVRCQAFGEHAHELFNDIDQDEVFGALGLWLRERFVANGSVVQDPGEELLGTG
jgi:alpha-beta hydrolase superfamily lysophospholipase